jgi:hypothetical protein
MVAHSALKEPPRRTATAPAALLAILPLLGAFALLQNQWYTSAPLGSPTFGANFSCKRAAWLGLDCMRTLERLLDDLGVRRFRLVVYWSEAEPAPGRYDWRAIDAQLDALHARGAKAVVVIGMKGPRWPEFWFPHWLERMTSIPAEGYPEDAALVQDYLFPYLEAAAKHLAAHPAVEAIQVENEPFVYYRGHANKRHLRPALVAREIETVRRATGGRLPTVVSHASWFRGDPTPSWILDHADVLAQSVYTKRQRGPWPWLYLFPYQLGPLTPDLPGQARAAARRGKELWIGELQAEPYEQATRDPRVLPTHELRSFSVAWLERNVTLARRSGATRVYFWGAEWWAYLRERRGDEALWRAARAYFRVLTLTPAFGHPSPASGRGTGGEGLPSPG